MTILEPCTADDYLLSFWTRQCQKETWRRMPPEAERKADLLRLWPYKYPLKDGKELKWQICRIDTQAELADLWIHQKGPWLRDHGLHHQSGRFSITLDGERAELGNLGVFAEKARATSFFNQPSDTGQYKNYQRWKNKTLEKQLDGHEKPILVQRDGFIDILDGFGRLLPYLFLVKYEHFQFFPFEAYYVCE